MEVKVNGESLCCAAGTSLLALLQARGLDPAVVVVERNAEIVPQADFAATLLCAGDALEIMHFVGGG
ncbi:MAG: sulfur carrier protein ThiS [Desulfovibrionaceae bacterium]|nr:sulfur carrier protein ThiS [Desulfovibrionaceae bacterium]